LGSAPDPAGGAYSAPPDALAGLKGHTSKGRGGQRRGRGDRRKRGREEREKGSEGREGEWGSPTHYFWLKSCTVSLQQYLYASGSLDRVIGSFHFGLVFR